MKYRRIYLLTALTFFLCDLCAQPVLSNLRKKQVPVFPPVQQIDSLSIVPGTFEIPGIVPSRYKVDEINASLQWISPPDSGYAWITYRVFPERLNSRSQRYNYDSVRFNFLQENPVIVKNASKNPKTIFNFGGLRSEGSFGRALSFGNNQDAVVNSSMNLQLQGYIGDSLELTAAVTDNNLPIQPEGNTQDLRDFDRIFLQIKKRGWQVNFGDIDLRQNKSYFLNFYKRIQGVSFLTENNFGKIHNSFLASGAIAKGKFNRQVLTQQEGNQGPYRLQGANNELYFVILAGTERVFIDGQLLQRGEDQDYVINYNTAELTFTPRRLITKDLRIQVEFEYSDRNYLNSQVYATNTATWNKRLALTTSYYSNSDAKNTSIDQVLDNRQKQFLSGIGDSLTNAYYGNAQRDTFSTNKLLYEKIDTVYNGIHDSIFVLSADPNAVLYSVSFSYLGPGKGNYTPLRNATNGQSFQWVSPDAFNRKTGEWEPVTLLVTPKSLRIIQAGLDFQLNTKTKLFSELAVSSYDINLFSSKDKKNDDGVAAKFGILNEALPLNAIKRKLFFTSGAAYEYVNKKFRPLERLRNVEFLRDWSLAFDATPADEHLISGAVKLEDTSRNYISYQLTNYRRSDDYNGFRNVVDIFHDIRKWKVSGTLNSVFYNQYSTEGKFTRPHLSVSHVFPRLRSIQLLLKYSGEYNKVLNTAADTLTALSFGFSVYEATLRSDDSKLNKLGLTYFMRRDRLPYGNKLLETDRSNNYSAFAELLKNEKHQVKFTATLRELAVLNLLSRQKPDRSFVGRIEYNVNELNGFITGNVLYEPGTGQEQRREFTFVEVPAGQGEYTWIDYNSNGIPELNEFEIAIFQDQKKYIRVFTPGSTYVKANYLQFNYSIDLEPKLIIPESKGFKNILRRTSTSSALQINKKNIYSGNFLFNPFSHQLLDTTLVTLSSYFSNTIYFNRTSTRWGFELTHSKSSGKALLSYGFESRDLQNLISRIRVNVKKNIISSLMLRQVNNTLATSGAKFNNRNYNILQHTIEPSVTYIYRSTFRSVLSYAFTQKKNRIDSLERSVNHALTADLRYNILSRSTLSAKFTFNRIGFTGYPGAENSTAGFILLEGLLPGRNYLWSIDLTRQLVNSIEISLQYEGRKPGEGATIHTGRASLRAIF